jgi:hypothetical protein
MPHPAKQYLRWIRNSNGGYTKETFLEDAEPLGNLLWDTIEKEFLVVIRDGKLYLTEAGNRIVDSE